MLSQRILWMTVREPRRGGNSDFAMTIWCMWISDCKYLLLLVEVFGIDCLNEFCALYVCVCASVRVCERERVTSQHISYLNRGLCVCVCVSERERDRQGHIIVESAFLIVACVQTHMSFITVCRATLFPLGLELMVKLRTLLTVFTFILKAKAGDYG